ncbi:MAG: hypothetical protein R2724_07830 [Bryobacterales bacterium]
MPEVEAVNELIAALPDPPAGWEAEDAKARPTNVRSTSFSASRVYTKGEQRVEVKITDCSAVCCICLSSCRAEVQPGIDRRLQQGDHCRRGLAWTRRTQHQAYGGQAPGTARQTLHIEIDQSGGGPEVYDEWYGLIKKDVLPKAK